MFDWYERTFHLANFGAFKERTSTHFKQVGGCAITTVYYCRRNSLPFVHDTQIKGLLLYISLSINPMANGSDARWSILSAHFYSPQSCWFPRDGAFSLSKNANRALWRRLDFCFRGIFSPYFSLHSDIIVVFWRALMQNNSRWLRQQSALEKSSLPHHTCGIVFSFEIKHFQVLKTWKDRCGEPFCWYFS